MSQIIKNIKFTKSDYESVLAELNSLSDEKYKKFNESLIPGIMTSYGVRVPQVRALAMKIVKADPVGFLQVCKDASFEEIQLHGFVVANIKMPLQEKLPLIKDFVPLIDNWSICDTFCFNVRESEKEVLWDFLQEYFINDKTYFIRYAVVTGMSNFVNDRYINEFLSRLSAITHDDYYVKMAVAWALCDCFIKQRAKTNALLSAMILDPWTQNKAIQKCRESRRVSPEDKEYLLSLKQ